MGPVERGCWNVQLRDPQPWGRVSPLAQALKNSGFPWGWSVEDVPGHLSQAGAQLEPALIPTASNRS